MSHMYLGRYEEALVLAAGQTLATMQLIYTQTCSKKNYLWDAGLLEDILCSGI